MKEVSIIGVDLAKQVFQLHGATAEGEVVFRKKLSRKQFLAFMQRHPGCLVAMEYSMNEIEGANGPSLAFNRDPAKIEWRQDRRYKL